MAKKASTGSTGIVVKPYPVINRPYEIMGLVDEDGVEWGMLYFKRKNMGTIVISIGTVWGEDESVTLSLFEYVTDQTFNKLMNRKVQALLNKVGMELHPDHHYKTLEERIGSPS